MHVCDDFPQALSVSPANALLAAVGILFTAGRCVAPNDLEGGEDGVIVLRAGVNVRLSDSSANVRTLCAVASGTAGAVSDSYFKVHDVGTA